MHLSSEFKHSTYARIFATVTLKQIASTDKIYQKRSVGLKSCYDGAKHSKNLIRHYDKIVVRVV